MNPKDPKHTNPPPRPQQPPPNIPVAPPPKNQKQKEKNHVPRSTLIIFWIFIGYIIFSFIASVYFITTTKLKLFNLNQIASVSTNVAPQSIDLPFCTSATNKTALTSSTLENIYSGTVYAFEPDISSQSAEFQSTITLQRGSSLFTYYIGKNEIQKVVFYPARFGEVRHRSIEGLEIGERVRITEILDLQQTPQNSKTRIIVEVL